MGMTPSNYFHSFVTGNVLDYLDNPGCVRRAFNAAVSASHLADHCYEYNRRHNPDRFSGFESMRAYLVHLGDATGGAFTDIRSISNAYKHLYTVLRGRAVGSVSSAGAIECISLEEEAPDEEPGITRVEMEFADAGAYVQFTRRDGTVQHFQPVIVAVEEYWFRCPELHQ
jgi:hypothetical protein